MAYGHFGSSLRDLPRLRNHRRRRASSWDRTGGNNDWVGIEPGHTEVLANIQGAGSIEHIWMTAEVRNPDGATSDREPAYLRKMLLKMYWDGEAEPSVLVPLGDFFGAGHARTATFVSLPIQMAPADGRAFNSYFHMPFETNARIEVMSELQSGHVVLYYYVDYVEIDELDADLGRFHAQWHRENPCAGAVDSTQGNSEFLYGGTNLSGEDNYLILDAVGRGHYVGCFLYIHNLHQTDEVNWYGEGDDMIFVDGDRWPPSLHGTGTEDYFDTAWGPRERHSSLYSGIILPGGHNWSGQISLYKFHIEDPIPFQESIRVTIEHGHANKRSDDYSSVAFWYQVEPHKRFSIMPVERRIPRSL